MLNKRLARCTSPLLACCFSFASTSCGNAWITTSEREQTLAALMSKADYAYDKSKFSEASDLFKKVLEKDPTFNDARVKLAYSINGEAGMSVLDFVTKFLTQEGGNTTADGGTSAGASSPAEPAKTSNPIAILTSTVGLDALDRESIAAANATSLEQVRAASIRFQKLQLSWNVICKLLPAQVFTTVFESEADSLKPIFQIENCEGGLPEGEKVRSAALFAASLQFMGQAAGLFETLLDSDGNGEIDIAETAIASLAKLETLQKSSSSITSGTDQTPEEYATQIKSINEQLETIRGLKATIDGEIVNYTLACFTFITALTAAIPNIPAEIAKKIENAATKINEGRAKLTQYSSFDTSSTNSEQGKKVKEAAQKASSAIDALYDSVDKISDPTEKAQRLEALNKQKDELCSNFSKTKQDFGLPADVSPPKNCDSATALTDPMSDDQESDFQNTKISDTNQELIQTSKVKYPLYKRVPLPSELNPNLNFGSKDSDDGEVNNQEAFVEFMMTGEEFRNR